MSSRNDPTSSRQACGDYEELEHAIINLVSHKNYAEATLVVCAKQTLISTVLAARINSRHPEFTVEVTTRFPNSISRDRTYSDETVTVTVVGNETDPSVLRFDLCNLGSVRSVPGTRFWYLGAEIEEMRTVRPTADLKRFIDVHLSLD